MRTGIGEFLRKERETRGVELAEVEAATRIRCLHLKAIEAEDWGRLPGEAYARAFTRTYASYLGVDIGSYMDEPATATPVVPAPRRGEARRSRVPLAAALVLIAGAIAIAVVLSAGGGDGGGSGGGGRVPAAETRPARAAGPEPAAAGTMALSLTAKAELWVCLLDEQGKPLVDGVVLPAGSEEGPFRSGSFTVSFGNGEVEMQIDGRETEIPESASPLGYEIGRGGELSQLDEAERPTCT